MIDVFVKEGFEALKKEIEEKFSDAKKDFKLIIGGDGTFLRNCSFSKPNLHIRTKGSVGSYKTCDYKTCEPCLGKYLFGEENKDYFIEDLTTLEVYLNGRKVLHTPALSDVLIDAKYTRKMFRAFLHFDGEKSLEIATGLFVYTPSGSTGYAKSCGQEKMLGRGKLGIAAIAPFPTRPEEYEQDESMKPRLFPNNPLVFDDDKEVLWEVISSGTLSFDCQNPAINIKEGDRIKIRKSKITVKKIVL